MLVRSPTDEDPAIGGVIEAIEVLEHMLAAQLVVRLRIAVVAVGVILSENAFGDGAVGHDIVAAQVDLQPALIAFDQGFQLFFGKSRLPDDLRQ